MVYVFQAPGTIIWDVEWNFMIRHNSYLTFGHYFIFHEINHEVPHLIKSKLMKIKLNVILMFCEK